MLRTLTGKNELVTNSSNIFMDLETGLRNKTCLEELVRFEWASTRTSNSVKNLLLQLQPGIRESQLRWILKNKDKEVYFLFTDYYEKLLDKNNGDE